MDPWIVLGEIGGAEGKFSLRRQVLQSQWRNCRQQQITILDSAALKCIHRH